MASAEWSSARLCCALLLVAAATLAACSHAPRRDAVEEGQTGATPMPAQEPRSAHGNPASYEVFGQRYYTLASSARYRERGVASWYGRKFHGRRTSSGEIYDMHALTAAHKSLPLPTWAEVTNLRNGKRVIVRINDRGPFVKNRLIDLSYAAATQLDLVTAGTGLVEVRVITSDDPADGGLVAATPAIPPDTAAPDDPDVPVPAGTSDGIGGATVTRAAPIVSVASARPLDLAPPNQPGGDAVEAFGAQAPAPDRITAAERPASLTASIPASAGTSAPADVAGANTSRDMRAPQTNLQLDTALANPSPTPDAPAADASGNDIYLQVGAFGAVENARRLRDRLFSFGFDAVGVHTDIQEQRQIFRVRLGPILDVADFDRLVDMMRGLDIHDTYLAVD